MADGLRELRRACREFPDQVEAALSAAVADEARDVRRDERKAAPVLTGELREGIEWRRDSPTHATVGIFNTDLFWAIWIEWGRKNAAAQPFATPAAEQSRRRWPDRARQTVREVARAQR